MKLIIDARTGKDSICEIILIDKNGDKHKHVLFLSKQDKLSLINLKSQK